ncbi:hypothetical protein PINS_up020536 [Pythium insidiosum]|nr:hypothetical protein PINS_up020536 [Pythium insidiosum]
MEIFAFHPDLKKWTEIGNSGVFRPEMLRPMGLPENVRVIAWGLSLERPTMIKYRLSNIRDLFGHKVDSRTAANSQALPLLSHPAIGHLLWAAIQEIVTVATATATSTA